MKIVISGSSGFLGQNLLKSIPNSKGVSLRENGWRKGALQDSDIIINLVGKAHDHKKESNEKDFYYANFELTKQVFEAFADSSAGLLIHVSSIAAVEEIGASYSLTEYSKCSPESWYGRSKRKAEQWLMSQRLPQNKKLIILRPPMVHGAGDKGNLGLLFNLIARGIPYPLAAYDNKRSFISIGNFNYFLKQIIKKYENLESGIYHVSDDDAVSTKEIIELIKKVTKKGTICIAIPKYFIKAISKVGDVFSFFPLNSIRLQKMTSDLVVSNKKIKDALNIDQLPFSAKEGLVETFYYFKDKYK